MEILDFGTQFQKHIIDEFKSQDKENYNMYRNSGLSDDDIYQIVTAPDISKLYKFFDSEGV